MACNPEGMTQLAQTTAQGEVPIQTPPEGDAGIMDSPGLEGSFQQVLAENLGRYVQIDFLVGVQTLVRRSGILYAVGRGFVTLYDETNDNFVMCDVFSAKFVAFFARRPRPGELPNNPMGILQGDARGNLWPVENMSAAPNHWGREQTWSPTPQPQGQLPAASGEEQRRDLVQDLRQRWRRDQTELPVTGANGVRVVRSPGWVSLDLSQP